MCKGTKTSAVNICCFRFSSGPRSVGRHPWMVEKSAPRRRTTTAVSSRCSSDMDANGGRTVLSGLAAAMGFNGERPSVVGTGRRASVNAAGVGVSSEGATSRNSDAGQAPVQPRRRRCSLGAVLMPSSLSGGGSCGEDRRTNEVCARLEGVAKKLEARSAGVGEAQLRAILLEHQSSLEAQQLAQTKKFRDEIRSLADVQRQQALSMSSIVSSLANLEARGGGGGGSGGGGISLGMADAHQLHEKMESGKAAWPKHRLGSTAPRHPCFLRLALLALGCAPHSGGTALPSAPNGRLRPG